MHIICYMIVAYNYIDLIYICVIHDLCIYSFIYVIGFTWNCPIFVSTPEKSERFGGKAFNFKFFLIKNSAIHEEKKDCTMLLNFWSFV